MIWAVLVTLVSVLGGTLLALVPRGRDAWMGPIRTFALTAALSVVVLHLLPEALGEVGPTALFVFLAGLLAPEMLGKLGNWLWRAGHKEPSAERKTHFAIEAGYFGLLLHRVGDGVGLGAFTGGLHSNGASVGVVTALAAHAVPVVAIVVLTFDSIRGRGSALKRAAGLGAASMVGVLLASLIPTESVEETNAWIAAFVGGTLLHVVTHDLGVQLPKNFGEKLVDLGAGLLGVWVSFLGKDAHAHHHEGDAVGHFEDALLEFSMETGPLLILGLFVGAALGTWGAKIPASFFRSRGVALDAARGTLIGAPLPLCSCSVLPISAALKGRGAGPALVVAFLLSTPELGVETFALSVRFLGWELAWLRLGGALLVAFAAAMTVGLIRRGEKGEPSSEDVLQPAVEGGSVAKRLMRAFDELFHHIGSWMILGVVGAALLEVAIPADALGGLESPFVEFAVITLVAVPSYVCAPSATPLAAVLLAKGVSPGAVLVGLLLGPATNVATLVFLRRWFGGKAAFLGVGAVVLFSWVIGFGINALGVEAISHSVDGVHSHEYGILWKVAAALSGALLLRALFSSSIRGFLVTLQGEHGHSHEGGHSHGGHSHGGHAH